MTRAALPPLLYSDGTTIEVGDEVFHADPHIRRGIRVRCYVLMIRLDQVLVGFPASPEGDGYGSRGRWTSAEFLSRYEPYATRSHTRRVAADPRVLTRQRARTPSATVHHSGWRE